MIGRVVTLLWIEAVGLAAMAQGLDPTPGESVWISNVVVTLGGLLSAGGIGAIVVRRWIDNWFRSQEARRERERREDEAARSDQVGRIEDLRQQMTRMEAWFAAQRQEDREHWGREVQAWQDAYRQERERALACQTARSPAQPGDAGDD